MSDKKKTSVETITSAIKARRNEQRSKRVPLLLQPSLYNAIKKTADDYETSVNDLIHEALKQIFLKD